MKINDHHKQSGSGRISWVYFDFCQSIWGSSHSTNPIALTSSLNSEEPQTSIAEDACDGSTSSHSADTEAPTLIHSRRIVLQVGNVKLINCLHDKRVKDKI